MPNLFSLILNSPKGNRIPVASVKGRCPRPLDDGAALQTSININHIFNQVNTLTDIFSLNI